jgi:hypothetical protein
MSFVLSYAVYAVQVLVVTRARYQFGFDSGFWWLLAGQGSLVIGCFVAMRALSTPLAEGAGVVLIIVSGISSYIAIDRRVGLTAKLMGGSTRLDVLRFVRRG